MHAISTILLLASAGAGALAIDVDFSFHGFLYTSSDNKCRLLEAPILPSDNARGQFSDDVAAIKSELYGCKVNLREEVDGKVEAEPVLIIKDGDMGCHELPSKGLHWDVDCGEDKE